MSINFIAEVSSNHSRDLTRSLEFIDTAAEIGCDSVKFQLFKVKELFAPEILAKSEEDTDLQAAMAAIITYVTKLGAENNIINTA